MKKVRIKVVKMAHHADLARQYGKPDIPPCPGFAVGQEFVMDAEEQA